MQIYSFIELTFILLFIYIFSYIGNFMENLCTHVWERLKMLYMHWVNIVAKICNAFSQYKNWIIFKIHLVMFGSHLMFNIKHTAYIVAHNYLTESKFKRLKEDYLDFVLKWSNHVTKVDVSMFCDCMLIFCLYDFCTSEYCDSNCLKI